ncbi:hypothetical protein [Anaeromyxobacter oryzae]|uniref:Uncharacterized protein n=1 Tax=Anaeromyxobacter oryzae TaxID=2918170 RepID=A0ABM7X2N4_9BACT|nr:hypothetical protein [Anaeromyxobacter oryzae]BDG05996.1 hypothetical protein AMOR_49920 [Anaeromyxobacter oryzae]
MTRPEQRETERRHIEEFLRLAGITATSFDQPDPPDAILTIDGRRVAVEHCELFERDLAENRSNVLALEGLLTKELKASGLCLLVGIGANAASPAFRRLRTVERLAKRLAALALAHKDDTPFRPGIPWIEAQGFPEIVMISVQRSDEPLAIVSPSFWGPGTESIGDAVMRKEAKLGRYRALVDDAWLLLVTGVNWTQATDSVITSGLQVESGFDAVYLLDLRESVVQTLKRSCLRPE